MAINAEQLVYGDTGEAVPGAGGTESTSPVYSYLADGAVRQAAGSGDFELLTSDGWKVIGTPPHAESSYYVTTALSSPVMAEFLKFAAEHPDQLNREQQIFMQDPLTSLDSYGQGFRWGENNLYDNVLTPQFAGTVMQTGDASTLTADETKAGGEFNYTESAEQQAARDTDDGEFLTIAFTVAAMVMAPYIVPAISGALGVSNTVAAAIYGGAKSIITGGDIGDVLTGAVLGGAGAEFAGGAAAGSEGDWYAGMTGGEALDPSLTTFASNATQTDVPVQNEIGAPDLSNAAQPYTSDDYRWDMELPAGQPAAPPAGTGAFPGQVAVPSAENYAVAYPGEGSFGPSIVDQGNGIIDKFLGFAKENAALTTAMVGAGGAAISGIGSALLNKSAQEEKIQAEKDLVAQKFNQETQGKRDFVQSNPSVFNWRRRFAPSGKPLRRMSTGQPVYQGGIIARRMRGA